MENKGIEVVAVVEDTADPSKTNNIPTEENEEDMSKLKNVVTEAAAQGAKLLVAWIWARFGRKKE